MHDVVAHPKLDRGGQPRPGGDRGGRTAAVDQAALRDDGQLKLGREKAVAQPRLREPDPWLLGGPLAQERHIEAGEVEPGPLGLAAASEGDDRPVAGAEQLFQLALGLAQRPRRELGALRAEGVLLSGVRTE